MNAKEWLKSVQENPEKSPIPPVPPEGGLHEISGSIGTPPVPPCISKHFVQNKNNLPSNQPEQEKIHWGDEPELGGSGGDRGKQEKATMPEAAPLPTKPRRPFLTPGGALCIPFDSDPKYHWWKGGQSVEQTRAEVEMLTALCIKQAG